MTPQEKEQYFAQYWGQNVARYKGDPKIVNVDSGLMNCLECFENVQDNAYLELNALENIKKEEAIEVAKMFGCVRATIHSRNDDQIILTDNTYLVHICFNGYICITKNGAQYIYNQDTLPAHHFLQSRGYALSFRNYSIDALINEGVLKLKS